MRDAGLCLGSGYGGGLWGMYCLGGGGGRMRMHVRACAVKRKKTDQPCVFLSFSLFLLPSSLFFSFLLFFFCLSCTVVAADLPNSGWWPCLYHACSLVSLVGPCLILYPSARATLSPPHPPPTPFSLPPEQHLYECMLINHACPFITTQFPTDYLQCLLGGAGNVGLALGPSANQGIRVGRVSSGP